MPFWIQMPYGSDRPTPARRSENFEIHGKDDYWPPYLAGYPLTPEIRSRLPRIMPIEGPKRRPMPDIFNLGFGGSPNDFRNYRLKAIMDEKKTLDAETLRRTGETVKEERGKIDSQFIVHHS